MKVIDEGHGKRFDIIYSHLLEPFRQKLDQDHNELIQLGQSLKSNALKRKLEQFKGLIHKDRSNDMTNEEMEELDKRKQIDKENQKDIAQLDMPQLEQKFIEFIMQHKNQGKSVKVKSIAGVEFEGMAELCSKQHHIEALNQALNIKCTEAQAYWTNELNRLDRKIFQSELRQEDISQIEDKAYKKKGSAEYKKDPILLKLKEIYESSNNHPEHLLNILHLHLEEQEKKRKMSRQQYEYSSSRIKKHRLELIKNEFEARQGPLRAINVLNAHLKHLKFFLRFSDRDRKMIFQHAKYSRVPARTIIFNQGDIGDNMYVILKGRVSVEKRAPEYGNFPIVLALLKDGDHFGELGLIDQEKIEQQINEAEHPDGEVNVKVKDKFARRKASCITAEETDMLVLDRQVCRELYQNQSNREDLLKDNFDDKLNQDELTRKIAFLQKIPCFQDVDTKQLMPICLNIIPRTYSYGEFLIKQGEVPPGLMIIVKGQCQVVNCSVGHRKLKERAAGNMMSRTQPKQYGIYDPLLNDFNPETSVLNQINSMQRGFQNQKILID